MSDRDEMPLATATAEFLADMIEEIDGSTFEDREALLWALTCAAWPTRATEAQ